MVKNITYFNCKGEKTQQCKDTLYFRENGEDGFYSLADGVNSGTKSHIGARAVQKALADFWEKQPAYFFQASDAEIKSSLIEKISQAIYNVAKEDENVNEYASTLLVVCVSQKHGKYRWLHIGDGMIVKELRDGALEIESHPQNGITKQFTFTTTSQNLEHYLHVGEDSLQNVRRFLLFTDGAMASFYQERKLTENGREFLQKGTAVYWRILQQLEIGDDYSMVDILL